MTLLYRSCIEIQPFYSHVEMTRDLEKSNIREKEKEYKKYEKYDIFNLACTFISTLFIND